MKHDKTIWLATGLSYADRLAAFLCPFLVLKFLERKDVYAAVEYVIGLSIILATFLDAGLRGYVLYHARLTGEPDQTSKRSIQAYAPVLVCHLLLILGCAWLGVLAPSFDEAGLVTLSVARGSALSLLGLVTQLLILRGHAAYAPISSLLTWSVSCSILLVPAGCSVLFLTAVFFSGAFVALSGAVAYGVLKRIPVVSKEAWRHLVGSLRWGWPILVSTAASMSVANFSKVYAFSNFTQSEVVGFSFWMRVFSVVQISHVAVVSVLVLQIYQSDGKGLVASNLRRYLSYVAVPVVGMLCIALGARSLGLDIPEIPALAICLMCLYVCLWCLGAYFEIYMARDSRNLSTLLAAVIASVVYAGGLVVAGPETAAALAWLMCLSALTYTGLIITMVVKQ